MNGAQPGASPERAPESGILPDRYEHQRAATALTGIRHAESRARRGQSSVLEWAKPAAEREGR